MISFDQLAQMITTQWREELIYTIPPLPPEAKVVTGNPQQDAHMHYLETKFGIELLISRTVTGLSLTGYKVVDEKKFAWFVLRWS